MKKYTGNIIGKYGLSLFFISTLLLFGCIENDVDYPYTPGEIETFEVEGITQAADIVKSTRTVEVIVDETVDIYDLRITRMTVTNDAAIYPESEKVVNKDASFPEHGFAALDSIPLGTDTRIDFSQPVNFLLQTYQDYDWTIKVTQTISRDINFSGDIRIGEPVFDYERKQAIVYVKEGTDLSNLTVTSFKLGSSLATTTPSPFAVKDFSNVVYFDVTAFGRTETWGVNVLYKDESDVSTNLYARSKQAILVGEMASGVALEVQYKERNQESWMSLNSGDIILSSNSYTATITGLTPSTNYQARVVMGGSIGEEIDFTTATAEVLNNGSFDNWHQDPSKTNIWNPWALDASQFWDTGNRGATSLNNTTPSNTSPSTETSKGSGYAAMLESKYIVLKFAAGNIFTGTYVRTDGTDGVLSFGRPFTSYPTKLRINYKYTSATINRTNSSYGYEYLEGRPDSCFIYVALTDWDAPREIRTKPKEQQLFDTKDSNIIAYGEFTSGTTSSRYQQLDVELEYRNYRTPKYLVIVCTASKYGDYFAGGEGSTLWLDEFELLYD